MKARRAAKIIKRDLNADIAHFKEWAYLIKITRRHYCSLAAKEKAKGNGMMHKFYIHKANDYSLIDTVAELWNMKIE